MRAAADGGGFPLRAAAALLLAAALLFAPGRAAPALPEGPSRHTVEIDGTRIEVHLYKPPGYDRGPLLVSLHGLSRGMARTVEATRALADRHRLLAVMPHFDREHFPYWRYQGLGISRDTRRRTDGPIATEPQERWSSALLERIVEWTRAQEGQALEYYVIGHSAGGQFAGRLAAFAPGAARRIVIANPSSYVRPTREARFPYGYGGLPAALAQDETIERYLAAPVTLLLGTADTGSEHLDTLAGAAVLGANRYERGLTFFRDAETLARGRGWVFNWRLVTVPEVGHDVVRLYGAPQSSVALFPQP